MGHPPKLRRCAFEATSSSSFRLRFVVRGSDAVARAGTGRRRLYSRGSTFCMRVRKELRHASIDTDPRAGAVRLVEDTPLPTLHDTSSIAHLDACSFRNRCNSSHRVPRFFVPPSSDVLRASISIRPKQDDPPHRQEQP
uniref:Uncharacterized protein n=1 Tax=Picocystis salinarum TaxID=88271 RepID=A0A7S3UBP7_9CHLO|mmetsp:Transcript_6715/g.41021  ORF Transcript_6715/g.41021 Transcript_6715/m.41021 type:complete len:139 (+) Transcript_6715:715-1131(+)